MKLRFLYLFFVTTLSCILLMGNKNGRAAQANAGNTGAPGDQTAPNGTPRTCLYCHTGGALTSTSTLSVLDSAGNIVTQYVPGYQYVARLAINSTNALGYGFQMIALRDSANLDLDGFTEPGSNNYKLSTIPNGRTYAEHDNVSTPSVFNVSWTAPNAGTGPVTFYASGNAVNKNGFSSGDGPSNAAPVHLIENQVSTVEQPDITTAGVWPTILSDETSLQITVAEPGDYRLVVFDQNGRIAAYVRIPLQSGANPVSLPVYDWPPGIYFLNLASSQKSITLKLVKL